ncbi:hypothetical protein PNOK_0038000 [Pyrrhoderma noxium]|uniref:Cupredoxin n=1 Tax=Pyrrhoderma noxium TaxID=2282107 RepID=A0A286UUY7_9AGAM|nr:hypothetical protein PNOK_0038000 [Pyrrhoderma noxium]
MIPSRRITALAVGLVTAAFSPVRGTVFNVTVGGPGVLRYDPPFIQNAVANDQVVFIFKQKNHTATQSSFNDPCSPLSGGFDSGFKPVADSVSEDFPTVTVNVPDANPRWVYCRQANHCQQGMVFAINPTSEEQFLEFQQRANSTGTSTSTATSEAVSSTPSVVTVTATVTVSDGDVITTTYGSYPGSVQPTGATPQDHQVTVGGDGSLTFNPSNITAQPSDTITFQFAAKNHTATQSSFGNPCRPLGDTSTTGQVGFDSGFMPVSAGSSNLPEFTITVNDTAPIWVYCRQTGHCGQGMVFSVNAIESGQNNFAAFQARAKQINGTSTSTSSGSASSSTDTSGSSSGALSLYPISGLCGLAISLFLSLTVLF